MKRFKKRKYKFLIRRWLRRLVYLSVLGIGVLFLVAATVGTGIPALDNAAKDLSQSAQDTFSEDSMNRTEIEYEIHRFINQERQERGLAPIAFDTDLRVIARYHSEDMAEEDYFAHESPSGETMSDRYERFDYNCRVQTSSSGYMTGAENIAYTYADSDVETESGTVNHNRNETKIAQGLVRGWMNSQGHRENILTPEWNNEGIGVVITDTDEGTKVIATQNFC